MTLHCTENLQSGVTSEFRTRAFNTAVCSANYLGIVFGTTLNSELIWVVIAAKEGNSIGQVEQVSTQANYIREFN